MVQVSHVKFEPRAMWVHNISVKLRKAEICDVSVAISFMYWALVAAMVTVGSTVAALEPSTPREVDAIFRASPGKECTPDHRPGFVALQAPLSPQRRQTR